MFFVSGCQEKLPSTFDYQFENYYIVFPSKPKSEKIRVNSELGELVITSISAHKAYFNYSVSITELPLEPLDEQDLKGLMDATIQGAVDNSGGKITSDIIKEHVGIEFREFVISVQGGEYMVISRVFVVGNKLFQMLVTSPKDEFFDKSIRDFLNSFSIKK